ncbi:MAG: pteridine reductase [Coxiella sp. (in: Bacteria)]|nr:MAG: pteridine reductase [Coxiella sp. (in: g-proteobacteria)]
MDHVALITGSAKRIGAGIARHLHGQGYNVVIHYHTSEADAEALCDTLNQKREQSAVSVQGDLRDDDCYASIIEQALVPWGRLDVLVHNASLFLQTPLDEATTEQWDRMHTTNLKACFFLSQLAAPHLRQTKGCIVAISDRYAKVPKYQYSIYSMTKAALNSMVRSLAQELAPEVRVNAIAPGSMLVANTNVPAAGVNNQNALLDKAPEVEDIAQAVLFAVQSQYMTGQVITIDGGQSI